MELIAYLVSEGIPVSLKTVIEEIAKCGIVIGEEVERAALNDLHGKVETSAENSSGDIQAKLDVLSNDIMIKALTDTGHCSLLLSEEDDFAVEVGESGTDKYMVAYDPLDGSSNIDCNCCVGTIFSIYEDQDSSLTLDERVQKPGSDIVCAGYILYGPATELVVTFTGKGVQKFTLDSQSGLYIHTGSMDIRSKTKRIYCINEGNSHIWFDDMKEYIAQYRIPEMKYTQRYIGSMVADIHRTLLYGGMFCYPADERNMDGKLRLLYECFPMAKIIEEAGGRAIMGKMNTGRILDIIPQKLHQRVPVLLGSMVEIAKYEDALKSVLSR